MIELIDLTFYITFEGASHIRDLKNDYHDTNEFIVIDGPDDNFAVVTKRFAHDNELQAS